MIDYYYFIPDFFERYSAHVVARLQASGASHAEIQKQIAGSQDFAKMYKNPFFNAMFTYLEIVPVGLLVTLICALVLKRKQNTDNVVLVN
jgi:NADH:ubiquinone oxidoreductase subunit 6 (subunit J)